MEAVCRALRSNLEAMAAVTAVQAGGMVSWAVGVSHGCSLAIAAVVVQAALLVRWNSLRADRRDLCLELLIDGQHARPADEDLERECRRLRDPRFQARLGRTLDGWAALGAQPYARLELSRPIYHPRVVAAVQAQLRQLAARVRAGGAELRGVALLHRLLTTGGSPLYGKRVEPLRDELARALRLLG